MSNPTDKIASRHTPEPWTLSDERGPNAQFIVGHEAHGVLLPVAYFQFRPDAEHAISCIHALAGMNPEAVKDVVSALETAVKYLEANRPKGNIREMFSELNEHENSVLKPARAALAALKGSK